MKTLAYMCSLLIFLVLLACQKEDKNGNNSFQTLKNIEYGPHARNKMDVYLPSDRSEEKTKVFVWIHGGAWAGGDKGEFEQIKPAVDSVFSDYAYVSLNYRLFNSNTNANRFPSQEEDIKLALEFISSKLSEWKVSNKVIIAGASAGGHLALLQAFKHNQSGLIKACAAYYPPTELTSYFSYSIFSTAVLHGILNGNPSQRPEEYFQSSPVNFITSASVPTLFFHGTADDVVPIEQSYLLQEKLEEQNVLHDYIYFEGAGHAFSSEDAQITVRSMRDFVKELGL